MASVFAEFSFFVGLREDRGAGEGEGGKDEFDVIGEINGISQ